mgnify:CR=1 FL=1
MGYFSMESQPDNGSEFQFKDALNREWVDISSELERRYIFPSGRDITIERPLRLLVSESGGHRVFSASRNGTCYYVGPGWIAIEWRVREGHPHFVK